MKYRQEPAPVNLEHFRERLLEAVVTGVIRGEQTAKNTVVTSGLPRRRSSSRIRVAAVAAVLAIAGVAVGATMVLTEEDIERSLPAGALIMNGLKPTCTLGADGLSYRCTLDRPPLVQPAGYVGWITQTVDQDGRVNGACRGVSDDGLAWECYVGEDAVTRELIDPVMLGRPQPRPGAG